MTGPWTEPWGTEPWTEPWGTEPWTESWRDRALGGPGPGPGPGGPNPGPNPGGTEPWGDRTLDRTPGGSEPWTEPWGGDAANNAAIDFVAVANAHAVLARFPPGAPGAPWALPSAPRRSDAAAVWLTESAPMIQ